MTFEKLYENPEQISIVCGMRRLLVTNSILSRVAIRRTGLPLHFVIAPVYYHNHMLGELFSSPVNRLRKKPMGPGKILNPTRPRLRRAPLSVARICEQALENPFVEAFIEELNKAEALLER